MGLLQLLALCAAFAVVAADEPYFRYWSGYKLANLTDAAFLSGLDWFLNQTATISNCGGLRTYICPLLAQPHPSFVPDEIALLQYESEAEYHRFYATPIGKYYQGLHARYFDMTLSHSLVPVDFAGSVAPGNAYCLPSCNVTWNNYYASSSTFLAPGIVLDLLKKLQGVSGLEASVVGVYDRYVKLINFWVSPLARAKGAVAVGGLLNGTDVVGAAEQPAINVVAPLNLQFGTTVNVTIGPCERK